MKCCVIQEQYEFVYRASAKSLLWFPRRGQTHVLQTTSPPVDGGPVYGNIDGNGYGQNLYANTAAMSVETNDQRDSDQRLYENF